MVTALLLVAVALSLAARAADRRPPFWVVVAGASVADTLVAVLLDFRFTLRAVTWAGLMTLMWVTVPVAVGSWRLARVACRAGASVRSYVVSLLIGLSVGWVLVPFVVGVIGVAVIALAG